MFFFQLQGNLIIYIVTLEIDEEILFRNFVSYNYILKSYR